MRPVEFLNLMSNFFINFIKRIDAILAVAGMLLITAGVAMYSIPTSLIAAGCLLLFDVYLSRLKGKK
jgi:hypothetical protein